MTDEIDYRIEFAKNALDRQQDMIKFGDSKLNTLFSLLIFEMGIGMGLPVLARESLEINFLIIFLLVIFALSSLMIITMLIIGLTPKISIRRNEDMKKPGHLFFIHVSEAIENDFCSEMTSVSKEEILSEYSTQCYENSKIASRKMKYATNISWMMLIESFLLIVLLFAVWQTIYGF